MTPESKVQALTVAALEAAGVACMRLQSGKVRVSGGWMQLCPKGTPDILCVDPYGFVELKRPGKPKDNGQGTLEAQRKFREFCQRRGIPHIQTDNPKEAVSYILSHGWKSGHMPV